jgi:hypothetical protein
MHPLLILPFLALFFIFSQQFYLGTYSGETGCCMFSFSSSSLEFTITKWGNARPFIYNDIVEIEMTPLRGSPNITKLAACQVSYNVIICIQLSMSIHAPLLTCIHSVLTISHRMHVHSLAYLRALHTHRERPYATPPLC